VSGRVKARPRASQVEMGAHLLREYEEAVRRREQWAEQQAVREQLEQTVRRQGWRITERSSPV
jgi:hypothetical protein